MAANHAEFSRRDKRWAILLGLGMIDEKPAPDEVTALQSEVREWALGLRWMLTLIIAVPLFYMTRVILMAPKFESIFEDMLGSQQKLPTLTRLILGHPMQVLALTWGVAFVAALLIFKLQKPRHIWITAIAVISFLILSVQIALSALTEPLWMVIQNLSGGGGS